MQKSVVVIGSFVMDMIAHVNAFPVNGQTVIGQSLSVLPGGKGANQAVAAARQGACVSMLGAVGTDAYGGAFLKLLQAENISSAGVSLSAAQPTATGMIMLDAQGENRIIVIPGANHAFPVSALEDARELLSDAGLVMLQLELLPEVTERAVLLCAELHVPVLLDPAPAAPIAEHLWPLIDYLTPNESELAYYAGFPVDTDEAAARAVSLLLAKGVRHVVATLGARGAVLGGASGVTFLPPFTAEAVDTVGAGDAFNGGLAAALMRGEPLVRAARYACASGALAVTKPGGIPAMPSYEAVSALLAAQDTI